MKNKRVVIIGAGPAGLTAAYELARAGCTDVTVLEATTDIGGLSKTVNYKGNRIDIGGHRFFSKSDWVMDWWLDILPLAREEAADGEKLKLAYQGKRRDWIAQSQATLADSEVMLVRGRLSRIYFAGKFFDYPLKANVQTALKLGLGRCMLFAFSYLKSALFPRRPERTLEDFFINRFGYRLYLQFFKSYTEKVWGTPCNQISAAWGAQRVKSLSIGKALLHALRKLAGGGDGKAAQTSLIEQFLYPKYGPGLMWETVAARAQQLGVKMVMQAPATSIERDENRLTAVQAGGVRYPADYVISTMPVRDLVQAMDPPAPAGVRSVAGALEYRDFITVGLLYRKLAPDAGGRGSLNLVPDNWIYIQEAGVKVGRLQVFNNWSPYMVSSPDTAWVGMEYFCREGDELWTMADDALLKLGVAEMQQLKLAHADDFLDGVVIRMPKAYPGYYGAAYERFTEVTAFLDPIENLFLVGRNGMHRYNNQDHSMLSARLAVENILSGRTDKANIWAVNIDDEYHEESSEQTAA